MQTIRDYARDHGISYEAVRAQLARYRKDLAGHIVTNGRTMHLDDYAVRFLDAKRRGNPVAIRSEEKHAEHENLKAQVDALKSELLAAQAKIIELQSADRLLIEAKAKCDLLIEAGTEKQKEIDTLRTDLSAARQSAEQLRTDLSEAQINAHTAKVDADRALEELRTAQTEAERAKADADQARKERDTAQAEARSYRKSIFGLYRKTRS